MSRGRLTFNLQDAEQMEQFKKYIGVEDAGRKSKRMEKDKERGSSVRGMRDTSKDL